MATIFTENYSGDYGDYYEFKVDATESDVSNSANTSKVTAKAYVRRTNSSSNGAYNASGTAWSITIDGTKTSGTSKWDTRNTSSWQLLGTAEKTITHDSNGSKKITISGTHTGNSASGSSKMGNASGSGTFTLTDIPRYATITKFNITGRTLDSISAEWSTDAYCDIIDYSLNDGAWVNFSSSGTFTINNLKPNTNYTLKIRVRRADSKLYTTSSTKSTTTYDIARISSYSNFNLGDSLEISYTNPSKSVVQVGIFNTEGLEEYVAYRTVTGSSYTFNFTDEELDRMYKTMGTTNALEAKLYINTDNNKYRESKLITITLTGNQKTGHVNVNGSWKRSKRYVNVNGEWKRCVRWVNVNGTWRRCI